MKHDELKEKILGLYDGPVTEKERTWVETHLTSCQDCSQALEEYKKTSALLFAVPIFSEADEDIFTAKVMARVREAAVKQTISLTEMVLRWFLPLAGSTLVAAWVLFSVLPSTPELASMNDPSFFTAEPRINVNSLAPSTSSQSNEEIVVSWMRN
jgi:anti-sigma factor RsiW